MQWVRVPENNTYYIYTTSNQALTGNLRFEVNGQPLALYYTPNYFNNSYGMLVNISTRSALMYTLTNSVVTFSLIPLDKANGEGTQFILSIDSKQALIGNRMLIKVNNQAVDLEVSLDGTVTVIPNGNPPKNQFLFSSYPLGGTFAGNLSTCSTFDVQNNRPSFRSHAECGVINAENKQKLMDAYCSQWPMDEMGECLDICSKPSSVCFQGMKQLCKGNNLLTDQCQKFCNLQGVNCDEPLKAFCKQFGPEEIATSTNEQLRNACGCFMDQSYYDAFFDSFSKVVDYSASAYRPAIASCYLPVCSSSKAVKPYYFKQGNITCPAVQECIQVTNWAPSGGTFNTKDFQINQNNSCNFTSRM